MLDVRHKQAVLAMAAVGVLATVGVGAAAIPGTDGTVRACYATSNGLLLGIPYSKGDVRLVEPGESCRAYERPAGWSQTGPAGPQGEPGAPGAPASSIWAVLNPDGSIRGSSGVSTGGGTTHPQVGNYWIAFTRDITNCAVVLTSAGVQTGDVIKETEASLAGRGSHQIFTNTETEAGVPIDTELNVVVTC